MGAWNANLNSNDTFLDVYSSFFNLYNRGSEPAEISVQIVEEHQDLFDDDDDKNNALFALAFAQWEVKALDQTVFEQVKAIIETGDDLKTWESLGADATTLKKRKGVLGKFLLQISVEREKPKRRVKPKFKFAVNEIIKIIAPDNKKYFSVAEEFVNEKYIHTGASLDWADGGGSVFYHSKLGEPLTARWIDAHTLEITHNKDITFIKKDYKGYFCGDEVKVIYVLT